MAVVFRQVVEIDDEKPLGPQIKVARSAGVSWKTLIAITGYSRTYLWLLATENQARALVNKTVRGSTPWSRAH